MNKFITSDLNVIAVYFFYNNEQLVYIGRTCNLKNRLAAHFNTNSIDFQDWKLAVDSIKYIECKTNTDSDILETYFINKYKPIYNKDKVYTDECSFDINYNDIKVVPKVIIKDSDCGLIVDIKLNKKISFQKLCVRYIEAIKLNDITITNLIESDYPLIKKAYETLGADKIKALDYRKNSIKKELLVNSGLNNNQKIVNLLNLKVGELVNKTIVKAQLQSIYNQLGIKKKAKATDLSNWYTINDYDKRVNGKCITFTKIITCNLNCR